eukprot:TRINITY_DN9420_c0_g1_i1.p1 TRINITY_DN9420_c0_g1~~TRINITY_DN9420_c0_g1_i1.p1  ORF type:complete len:223 (+),score=95.35 TRINITY_DN9420_c0_g1_i1:84-752(+)
MDEDDAILAALEADLSGSAPQPQTSAPEHRTGAAAASGPAAAPPAAPPAVHPGAAELRRLTTPQLQLLQHSQSAYEVFFHSLPQVRSMLQEHAEVQSSVERKAVENCSAHGQLQRLQSELAALKAEAEQRRAALRTLQHRRAEHARALTPDRVVAQLEECAAEAERRSERISEEWQSGSLSLERFVADYTSARKDYHVQHYKLAQGPALAEQVRLATAAQST